MSLLEKSEQKRMMEKYRIIPIVKDVTLVMDTIIKPHDPEPTQKIGFHMNTQEVLKSMIKNTYPTIPINVEHIEIPKITNNPVRPEFLPRESRIYKAIDRAMNPLWSNELNAPMGRKELINRDSMARAYAPAPMNPYESPIGQNKTIGGYDMGKPKPIEIRATANMPSLAGYNPSDVKNTLKQMEETAKKKLAESTYCGGVGYKDAFDPMNRKFKGNVVWKPVQY